MPQFIPFIGVCLVLETERWNHLLTRRHPGPGLGRIREELWRLKQWRNLKQLGENLFWNEKMYKGRAFKLPCIIVADILQLSAGGVF